MALTSSEGFQTDVTAPLATSKRLETPGLPVPVTERQGLDSETNTSVLLTALSESRREPSTLFSFDFSPERAEMVNRPPDPKTRRKPITRQG